MGFSKDYKGLPKSAVIIRVLMETNHMTIKQMADKLGIKNPSGVSSYLDRDMKYSTFTAMLDAMGYEIKIHPKYTPDAERAEYERRHAANMKITADKLAEWKARDEAESAANTENHTMHDN